MQNEKCKDCRFWQRWQGDSEVRFPNDNGWCHRFPPVNVCGDWLLPTTNEDDWCGEFRRVEGGETA